MKYACTLDWKYVLVVSLILISIFMTALGFILESL